MAGSSNQLLNSFDKLSEAKDHVRVDAAIKIMGQIKVDPSRLTYCLTRLIRGLGSSRAHSRQGFFITLTELLKQAEPGKQLQEMLVIAAKAMEDNLQQKGTKAEEGDFLTGRLFYHGALLRSNRLDLEATVESYRSILDITTKRNYLVVPGHLFVIDHIKQFESSSDFLSKIWPLLQSKINWKSEIPSLESLWLLIVVKEKFPKALNKHFMMEHFGRKKLITEEFASTISKSMSDAFTTTPIYVLKSHPFFPALLKAFQTEGKLQEFWTLHIEPQIGKGNTYQSKMGFAILDLILSMVDDKKSTMIYFTVNVRETALAFLSKLEASSQDESLILSCLAKITAAAKDCPEIQKDVLNALLTFPGNIAFDKATGGNVVRQLIAFSSKESIQHVGVLYRRAIMGQPDSGQERNSMERVYAAHQLAKLVSHSAMQDDLEWKVETLNFLLMCTLFDVKSEIPPLTSVPLPFSREAKLEIKDVFFKALDFKAKNIEGMSTVLRKVANFADGLFSQASMIKPFGLDAKKSWRQAMKDIDAISDGNKKENQVFQLLYLHMAFQLMSEPDMAKETLADLRECYQRSCRKGDKTKKKKKKSSAAASREEEEEPQWVEVVIDLLLSLLSQNKHVLRQLVNSIFSLLCPHMSIDALKVITDVINPTSQESANETVNGDNDSDDEYETEDEEEIVGEDDKEKEADDDSEEEEDDDSEDDEDMGNGNVPDELVAKLKAAMGEEGNNQSDAESVNMDDIPEEDMNKMDEALANVFKQLSGKKGGAEKRKEQKDVLALMHFKTRALDMVDVYLGQNPYLSHVLFIIDFVLAALETVSKKKELKPLECRLRNTLKKVTNLKKPAQIKLDDQFDSSAMVDVLQGFVELANGGSPLMSLLSNPIPLFAQCCTLIVKFSQQMGGQDLSSKIQGVYERAIEDFFSKNSCVLPMPFFSLPMQSNWPGSWNLANKFVENAFDPKIRQFRRTQALGLISTMFHNQALVQSAPSDIDVGKIALDIQGHFLKDLDKYQNNGDMKPRYLCELLNIMHGLHVSKCELNWDSIKLALEKFREKVPKNRHFHDVKKAFNKIGAALKIPVVTGSEKKRAKNQISSSNGANDSEKINGFVEQNGLNSDDEKDNGDNNDADEAAEPNKKKKRKKKQGKEGLKEKKEQKRFALEGQFKGMEMPSFAGVSLSDNMNFENTKADPEEADHSKNDTPAKLSKKMKRKSEGGAILGENGNETKKKKKGRRSLD